MAREITYNNFEISLVVFMSNITTNHAITYTNYMYSEIIINVYAGAVLNNTCYARSVCGP